MIQFNKVASTTGLIAFAMLSAVACSKIGSSAPAGPAAFSPSEISTVTGQSERFESKSGVLTTQARTYSFADGQKKIRIPVAAYEASGEGIIESEGVKYVAKDHCVNFALNSASCSEIALTVIRVSGTHAQPQSYLLKGTDKGYVILCSKDVGFASQEEAYQFLKKSCVMPASEAQTVPAPEAVQAQSVESPEAPAAEELPAP